MAFLLDRSLNDSLYTLVRLGLYLSAFYHHHNHHHLLFSWYSHDLIGHESWRRPVSPWIRERLLCIFVDNQLPHRIMHSPPPLISVPYQRANVKHAIYSDTDTEDELQLLLKCVSRNLWEHCTYYVLYMYMYSIHLYILGVNRFLLLLEEKFSFPIVQQLLVFFTISYSSSSSSSSMYSWRGGERNNICCR